MKNTPSMRGSTRCSIGEMPSVTNASISSVIFMLPSSAAKPAPVRPAMMMPVMRAPISRSMPKPTRYEA